MTHPSVEREVRIHAFVISWSGRDAAAAAIAQELAPHVEILTVIHSDSSGSPPLKTQGWEIVPDTHFYGMKFRRSLDLFSGDVMLQVQADTVCTDWAGLVAAARHTFAARPCVGVWSPDVNFTPMPARLTTLASAEGPLRHVAIIDGIVWALSAAVCGRLAAFDYTRNNVGWGIDWAAATFAHASGHEVLVDTSITVAHPMSRGYATENALDQLEEFLEELDDHERAMRAMIQGFLAPRRSDHPVRDLIAAYARDRRHRLRLWVDRVAGREPPPVRPVPSPELPSEP
jgi:hypothetical protein